MELKELLKNIKKEINLYQYEKNITLKDHPIPMFKNVYRLVYVNHHKIGALYNYYLGYGMLVESYDSFSFPDGMDRKDGFKVLSYLTDYIEDNFKYDECSMASVRALNNALDMEQFGFKRINSSNKVPIDLFTVGGNIKKFKNSKFYKKYFNWYTPNISKEQIEEIYNNLGMKFEDIPTNNKVKRR